MMRERERELGYALVELKIKNLRETLTRNKTP